MNNEINTALKSNPVINWDAVLQNLFNREVEKLQKGSQVFYKYHAQFPEHDITLAWYEHDQDEVYHCCDIIAVEAVFRNNSVRYVAEFKVRQYHNREYVGRFYMEVLIPTKMVSRLKDNYPEMWEKLLAI